MKEHPHQQMGLGLDYAFYKRVRSLPNVRLYSPAVRAESLYCDPNCLAVVVIAGTIGLEAALKRKPVFVFGRPIYYRGDCFIKSRTFEDFFLELKRIMNGDYKFDEWGLYAILQAMKDAVMETDVAFSKARSWLELSYLVNTNMAKLINRQYGEWAASRLADEAASGCSASGSQRLARVSMLVNASILITGGTGSFGHTFVPMTLAKYNPRACHIFAR